MITLHCKLTFENTDDKKFILNLIRVFSSCYRYSYNRLLDGFNRNDLKKSLQKLFNINSRFVDDAILKAQSLINSCIQRNQNPKKVIFGDRNLFNKIKKKHINGKQRDLLKLKWKERRKGYLFSRGDKSKKGNLNTRFILQKDKILLRINIGKRKWIYANVKRTVKRQNDKWIQFISRLLEAQETGKYFPYSVEIRLINGEIYAFVIFEEEIPEEPTITRENGVIGIDINARPFHLALATVKPDGNLERWDREYLGRLANRTRNQREYESWQVAHKIVEMAIKQNKAIAIEKLGKMDKGRRGDGNKKLRKIKQRWIYRGILEKIKIIARRKGVEVIERNPAYTTIIGMIKYAPQYSLDKDVAGALVIGRRALGFEEEIPKNYEKLINDDRYMEYAIKKIEEKIEIEREKERKEGNEYKRRVIRRRIREIRKERDIIKSHYSEPQTREAGNLWKEQMRGWYYTRNKLWRVVRAAIIIPILGRSPPRDLTPLKPMLVEGEWNRVVRRSVSQ